jgi:murein DD-endopeptidase MepM/ murein hydrolase activator NlpD
MAVLAVIAEDENAGEEKGAMKEQEKKYPETGKTRRRRGASRLARQAVLLTASGLSLLLLFSCTTAEKVPEPYRASHAHDGYRHALETAGLAETALGRDWIGASRAALEAPVDVELPLAETFRVDPAAAFAVAYRFEVKRGQRVEVATGFQGDEPGRLFIDLFREAGPTAAQCVLVASAGEGEGRLEFEPRRDARYILRLQPELLRGGLHTVSITKAASLGFPVAGKDVRAILSGFGVPRDGGRRVHHGVDIFARRHTEVLAPSDAVVHFVGDGGIGGNVIWLYDAKRSLYLYFAHLQTQDVPPYSTVRAGQKIGTVGNTGNARTTPPHLHFGIYMRPGGPVDPVDFIRKIEAGPEPVAADLGILGSWARASLDGMTVRETNARRSTALAVMGAGFPMRVLGAAGRQYRVSLPGGVSGYVAAGGLESAATPLESLEAVSPQPVHGSPLPGPIAVDRLEPGDRFQVLGRYGDHWLVETPAGRTGWIPAPSVSGEPPSEGESGSSGSRF